MKKSKRHLYSFLLSFSTCCFLWGSVVVAEETAEPTQPLGSEVSAASAFSYHMEGRPDPFLPFIKPQVATVVDPNEIIETAGDELTGMRQFEPGQLTLVATLFSGPHTMAMVEDVSGKGYILKQGTPIGVRGEITAILPQEVVVTETSKTRAGKELKNTIVMRLKKEGEQ